MEIQLTILIPVQIVAVAEISTMSVLSQMLFNVKERTILQNV